MGIRLEPPLFGRTGRGEKAAFGNMLSPWLLHRRSSGSRLDGNDIMNHDLESLKG
jgi:hypothetical protein